MKEEWTDAEREPRRGVQFYDREAQAAYKDWSMALKLEWLEGILKLYWASRQNEQSSKAAETRKPYPDK